MPDPYVIAAASAAVGGMVGCSWRPATEYFRSADWGVARPLRDEMIASGMDPAPLAGYLLAWRVLAVGLLLALWAGLNMPPVAVVAAGIAYHIAPWWVRRRIAAYRRRVNGQVAGAARNLAGQVRAGLVMNEALAAVSRDAPAPFGEHLRRTAGDVAHGIGSIRALGLLKVRVRIESVTAMVVALQVAEERGGRLADVLDRIAVAADEHARVERKRETDTAAGRLMIAIMAALPGVFLVLLHALDPAMLDAVTVTLIGQCVLAGVMLVVYASVRWGSRILANVK